MTYSIVARDPGTGELGIAVQSRYFAVGRVVPWIEAGVGAVASQAFTNPVYGHEALRRLRAGQEPRHVLEKLLSEDPGRSTRQVAILDARGRIAVHTGTTCVQAAGHATGATCCAQANMMVRDTVWGAMVDAFETSRGELADRLLAALDAAEREGGDLRGRQAAALVVVAGKSTGVPELDRVVDVRVDDAPDPIAEVRRLLARARAYHRAERALDQLSAGELEASLAALAACREAFPDEPEFIARQALVLLALGRLDEARAAVRQVHAIHPGWTELLRRIADAGLVPVRREAVDPVLADAAAAG